MTENIGDLCSDQTRAPSKRVGLRLVQPTGSISEFTFGELDALSNRFANVLGDLKQGPGKIVAILLPKCAEAFYGSLGILKLGSVVLPLFANFGALGLVDRLADARASCVITKRSLLSRLQGIRTQLPSLRTILLIDGDADLEPDILSLPLRMRDASDVFPSFAVQADTPSIVHYTSGSTGKPKGVLHVHGAADYLRRTAEEILQLRDDDIYWCTADHGWITGTSYGIIAPWLLGVTQVQFVGAFDPDAWFRVLQDQHVTVWYTAPTALRMLMRADDVDFGSYDISHLRSIFSVGEPLNPEISRWAGKVLRRQVHDTWFQTETGGIMIANRPGLAVKLGSMGKPVSSIYAEVVDAGGKSCSPGIVGRLCLRYPWSSMFRDYLNRTDAYRDKFSQDLYDSGDLAYRDADGYFWFAARADDVINTSGHLVSPFEIESCLLELPEVAESGAVGVPDPILFEKIVVFVSLQQSATPDENLALKIRLHVAHRLSAVATPQDVIFVDNVPKNKSGKILRRVLRARYLGQDPGDVSTLEDQL